MREAYAVFFVIGIALGAAAGYTVEKFSDEALSMPPNPINNQSIQCNEYNSICRFEIEEGQSGISVPLYNYTGECDGLKRTCIAYKDIFSSPNSSVECKWLENREHTCSCKVKYCHTQRIPEMKNITIEKVRIKEQVNKTCDNYGDFSVCAYDAIWENYNVTIEQPVQECKNYTKLSACNDIGEYVISSYGRKIFTEKGIQEQNICLLNLG